MKILEVRGLTKCFGRQKVLDNLGFELHQGEILGLLGPNGAGKTTAFRVITGLYRPSAGQVFIAGIDAVASPLQTKGLFGICTQEFSYNAHYNIEQDLYFYARLYGFPRREALEKARRALEWAGLWEHRRKNGRQLSGGMQKKILLARAMLNDPPLLLFDEPTTGLDVRIRREVWKLIRNLKIRGKSILLTTHCLEEAEELCDRVVIINRGRVVAEGNPRQLRNLIPVTQIVTIGTDHPLEREEVKWLENLSRVVKCEPQETAVELSLHGSPQEVTELLHKACARFRILRFSSREASLEEVFLRVTGEDGNNV